MRALHQTLFRVLILSASCTGHPCESKAVPARTNGQVCLRAIKMGAGIQGLSRQYRRLHEPPSMYFYLPESVLPLNHLPQLANTEEFQDGKSNGALGEVFIRYVPPLSFRLDLQ